MFSSQSMIEEAPLVPSRQPSNGQRVLACLLCQQRKVKCDRQFPCANCLKTRAECVPGTKIACRRKRFPEKKLLDRLRLYEDLLHENHIDFEPLNPDLISIESLSLPRKDSSENWSSSPSIASDQTLSPLNRHHPDLEIRTTNTSSLFSDNSAVQDLMARQRWPQCYDNNDQLFFDSSMEPVNTVLRPSQMPLFRI